MTLCQSASISGAVRVDADGDKVIDDGAEAVSGIRVVLLRAKDGHTEGGVAETTTDAGGRYRFDDLYRGRVQRAL